MTKVSVILLAAGIGNRLLPLTLNWPKCLMPIGKTPLLEYWLSMLHDEGIDDVYINLHHHKSIVEDFLKRPMFKDWVKKIYEKDLLGTAGTLFKAKKLFKFDTILMVHADNWSVFSLEDFILYHFNGKPKNCCMTMMTFECENPSQSGIVELDNNGVVINFHEKKNNPPGRTANGAVYMLDNEVVEYICENKGIIDFSTQVIPEFLGKIATWKNNDIHRDIGTTNVLKLAQKDVKPNTKWSVNDQWNSKFAENKIHQLIKSL